MEITEVRIKLVTNPSDKLLAFCSATIDNSLVIRDIKIIQGTRGLFVAMPSRKLTTRCRKCSSKNHLRARFCNECGQRLQGVSTPRDAEGRARLYADIAHPIHAAAREALQKRILEAYQEEIEKSKLPGYKPTRIYEADEFVPDEA